MKIRIPWQTTKAESRLEIDQLAIQATEFRQKIQRIKRESPARGFGWYPYDSLSNFPHLANFLTGERRFLLDLIGGRPVVDIGCGDGEIAFFLESLGCKVFAIDNPRTNFNRMQGVRALKAALHSSVEIFEQDIDYDLYLSEMCYGAVFLFGVLYHLKNPYRVLETLLSRCEYCFLSTRVARFTPAKEVDLSQYPLAYLVDETETNNDATNYWIFTNSGLQRLLKRSGWRVADYMTVGNTTDSDPVSAAGDERAFCLAQSTGGALTDGSLLDGWHAQETFRNWRWTAKKFRVSFPGSSAPEQSLKLNFFLPPVLEERFGILTLTSTVNGHALPSRSYTKSAEYVYEERVPQEALTGGPVVVEFSLDRAIEPSAEDRRELGIIVSNVSLDSRSPTSP